MYAEVTYSASVISRALVTAACALTTSLHAPFARDFTHTSRQCLSWLDLRLLCIVSQEFVLKSPQYQIKFSFAAAEKEYSS